MKPPLTIELLKREARDFAQTESTHPEPALFGVTDGKAVGTYGEHKFKAYLAVNYTYVSGSSASGIDLPDLKVDIKVTSIIKPQSSCPFKDARQKIFGLGYSLLVFVYTKTDDSATRTGVLNFNHVIFVEKERTADFTMTKGLNKLLDDQANVDDIAAFIQERFIMIDETEAYAIAEEVLQKAELKMGYLTISNALQWRLSYGRAIQQADNVDGIVRVI